MINMRAFLLEAKSTDTDNETEIEYLQNYQKLNRKRADAEEKIESIYELIDAATTRRNFVQRDILLQHQEEYYMISIDCENQMKALEESSVLKSVYEKAISKHI